MAYTYSDKRVNPITGAISSRTLDPEIHTIAELANLPGVYGVQLKDGIVQGTLTVTENVTGGAVFVQVTTAPLAGQVGVTYSGGINKRGLLLFNVADAGTEVIVDYDGIGSVNSIENVQAIVDVAAAEAAAVAAEAVVAQLPSVNVSGMVLSYVNTTTLGISAGRFWDSTHTYAVVASAFTKTTSAWAAGTGNGGLDTGSIATSTWYHWYAIYNPTTEAVDIIFSTSASAPTLPTGYTAYRLIGSAKTNGSSQWVNFIAHECNGAVQFNLYSVVQDYTLANPGTSAVLATLPSVPSGLSVEWIGSLQMSAATAAMAVVVTSPEQADVDPASGGATLSANTGQFMIAPGRFFTDTSRRLRYRCSASGASNSMAFNTYGWRHYR